MELIDFIRSLPTLPEREAFAEAVGSTIGHLRNVGYGQRSCDPALARRIETYTDGKVSRQTLRPNDWHDIWPELAVEAEQGA